MASIQTRPSELVVPVAALSALRKALAAEVGDDGAARALRVAGAAAGHAMFRALATGAGAAGEEADLRSWLADLPETRFWDTVSAFFASRGWGRLRFSPVHFGVGDLTAPDWIEADPASAARPCCFFTTGLLAGLLGRITGGEVAVLEVDCRSRGDATCRFLFGAPPAMQELYAGIAAGRDAEAALLSLA